MPEFTLIEAGKTIAGLLHQSWRPSPSPLPLPLKQVAGVLPQVLATGCGPLFWRRLRDTPDGTDPALRELRSAYRLASLQAAVHETEIAQVLAPLNKAGVRFLLIKGWAAARLYPEPGLRPYGDLDLLFSPDDLPRALALLPRPDASALPVEAHAAGEGTYRVLPTSEWEEILSRAEEATVDGCPVRIPGPEDHLRVLAFHFLVHGGWRPLWLCDLAAAVEPSHGVADWNHLLRGEPFQREWIRTALQLARDLLGADLSSSPGEVRDGAYPEWVRTTVLAQWGRGTGPSRREVLSGSHLRRLGTPARVWGEVREHWPNRIQACLETGTRPGAPLPGRAQLRSVGARLPRVLKRLGDRP